MGRLGGISYSPIVRSQENIARTLQHGFSQLGQRPLDEAQLGLKRASLEHEMARQDEMDEAAAPGRELATKTAQRGLEDFNTQQTARDMPLTAGNVLPIMFGNKTPSRETLSDFFKEEKWQKIMDVTGGHMDAEGNLFKANKERATGADLPNILRLARPIIRSGADYGHKANQIIREYDKIKKPTAEQTERYEAAVERKASPEWLIKQYTAQSEAAQRDIEYLRSIGRPTISLEQDNVRRERKIAKQQGVLAKQGDRAFEMQKLDITEAGKNIRAALKRGKPPTQKRVDAHNLLGKQHLVGWGQQNGYAIQMDEETGAVMARMTKAEIKELKKQAGELGFSVYEQPTEDERDRPGWFTGDDPLYSISIVPKFAEKGSQPIKTPGGKEGTANAFIDKFLPQGDVIEQPAPEMQLQPSHGTELQSSGAVTGQEALSEEEAIARANQLRGESNPIKIRMGKRKPGTPRP
jgi:hypothetical protein